MSWLTTCLNRWHAKDALDRVHYPCISNWRWRNVIKREKSKKANINEQIEAKQVRLIGADGKQAGIVSIEEALRAAADAKLDLVEIAPDSDPVVCKVLDYGKHVFEAKKGKAAAKKKQRRTHVKEMKFRPGTEEGDYQVKLRNLTRFLTDGDKAKVTLRFRGREMAHQEIGMELLKRIEGDLAELGTVELFPRMEGRQLTMVLAPKSKKGRTEEVST
jgi:translation initiation factor IF-3